MASQPGHRQSPASRTQAWQEVLPFGIQLETGDFTIKIQKKTSKLYDGNSMMVK